MSEEKIRKVFLEDLPRTSKGINWMKSIGYKIKFIYDDIQGELEIINYKSNQLYIKYLGNEIYIIYSCSFKNCLIGNLLGIYTDEFRIEIGTTFKDNKRDITITDRKHERDKNNYNKKLYKYKCNKCGYDEGWMPESNLIKGNGCPCCCPNPQKIVEGINSIVDTDP